MVAFVVVTLNVGGGLEIERLVYSSFKIFASDNNCVFWSVFEARKRRWKKWGVKKEQLGSRTTMCINLNWRRLAWRRKINCNEDLRESFWQSSVESGRRSSMRTETDLISFNINIAAVTNTEMKIYIWRHRLTNMKGTMLIKFYDNFNFLRLTIRTCLSF